MTDNPDWAKELRELRAKATKGPWTDDSDSYETWIFGADSCMILEMRGFGSEDSGGRPQGEHVHTQKFITWVANNSDAIAAALEGAEAAITEWAEVQRERKRMRKAYPPGTCNAEDAWAEFLEREAAANAALLKIAALSPAATEVPHGK